jgi:Leucine-rich repeat (LRR) protein
METVPSVVPKLKLKRLLLNNMLLTSLPDNIGDLETLEMLYATGNCFTKLPKSICKLIGCKTAVLSGDEHSSTRCEHPNALPQYKYQNAYCSMSI